MGHAAHWPMGGAQAMLCCAVPGPE